MALTLPTWHFNVSLSVHCWFENVVVELEKSRKEEVNENNIQIKEKMCRKQRVKHVYETGLKEKMKEQGKV